MAKKPKQKNSGTGQTVLLPAMFNNLTLLKDGSVNLKFDTRELSGEEISALLGYRNTEGWLQFSQNNEFKAPPKENAKTDNASPSERMRDVIYALYKDRNAEGTFETYYATRMEQLIELLKTKFTK